MSVSPRQWALAIALVGALAATGWVASQDQEDHKVETRAGTSQLGQRETRTTTRAATTAETPPALKLEKLQREPNDAGVANIFPSSNWQPPPPKVAANPAPPPPPSAPPLPFAAFGQMMEDGREAVFLNAADRSYVVRAGDVINRTYRVDTIRDGVVVLTYLPLNQQQTLRTGTN